MIKRALTLVSALHITASVFINDDERGLHADYEKWLDGAVRRARARTSVGALIRLLVLRAVALHARGRCESALSPARGSGIGRPRRLRPALI